VIIISGAMFFLLCLTFYATADESDSSLKALCKFLSGLLIGAGFTALAFWGVPTGCAIFSVAMLLGLLVGEMA